MSEDMQQEDKEFDADSQAQQLAEALGGNTLDFEISERGYAGANFVDMNGQECAIRETSSTRGDMLRLGADMDAQDKELLSSMLLSQDQVAALLPALQRFAETGRVVE